MNFYGVNSHKTAAADMQLSVLWLHTDNIITRLHVALVSALQSGLALTHASPRDV